jgi:transcriptional regulator with XRE-family HTH domain
MSIKKSHTDENIFSRMKSVRKHAGLSQALFADKIGLKQSSYNEIENGKREPSEPIITAIAYRFQINEEWLKSGEGDQFKTPTIAEQIGEGYGPEVKLMADYLEVKIKGKTAEERLQIVEEIMEQIRNKYK